MSIFQCMSVYGGPGLFFEGFEVFICCFSFLILQEHLPVRGRFNTCPDMPRPPRLDLKKKSESITENGSECTLRYAYILVFVKNSSVSVQISEMVLCI